MDIATILGLFGGFGLIVTAILLNGSLSAFIDAPSMVIVVGGTGTATLMSENLGACLGGMKVAMNAFFNRSPVVTDTIKTIAELAMAARKDGILALEKMEITDPFLAKAIRMAVDGIAPEEIRTTLTGEMAAMRSRHKRGQKLFKGMAGVAPSMGMIGTLIGLVQMLQALDDPAAIGPAMAVALLTTLYGAIVAFVVCNPIADKLEVRTEEETQNMSVIIEGTDAILKGENPRLIQEKLESLLAPKMRTPPDEK